LPTLLSATVGASVTTAPYGKIVFGQHLLYYSVFKYVPGESLRALLKKTPQLWVNHVGRIVLGMAVALTTLQSKGYMHLGVSPDSALVSFHPKTNHPQVLLIDLGLACEKKDLVACWYPQYVTPAYLAPELLDPTQLRADYSTDVYGIGLTLYEMLVGKPAIASFQQSEAVIRDAIQHGRMARMSRNDDVAPIAQLALQAVGVNRPATIQAFAQELLVYFKQLPNTKSRSWWNIETTVVLVVILLVVAFVIALFNTFTAQNDLATLSHLLLGMRDFVYA
jgi:serine/threonine protein kinase